MGAKKYFKRKLVEWDKIPCSFRWKKSVSGIGRLYADFLEMLQEEYGADGVKKLNKVMYEIGMKQENEILKDLGMEKDIKGCAYVLMAMHRIFGIKSKIFQIDKGKAIIHISHCKWGRERKGWTSQTCASVSQYEHGLVKSILHNAKYACTKKYTLGDDFCEIMITSKRGEK